MRFARVRRPIRDTDRPRYRASRRRREIYDVEPFNAGEGAVVTMVLEALDGKTKITSRSRFPSAESLESALSTGMVGGAIETWDRLAELVRS